MRAVYGPRKHCVSRETTASDASGYGSTYRSRRLAEQFAFGGAPHRFGARAALKRLQRTRDVHLDRSRAEDEFACDLLVALAARDLA
jgi:hypothetical protein